MSPCTVRHARFVVSELADIELKLNADIDGDGNITDDDGLDPYKQVLQTVVTRQQPGVQEVMHYFEDY